MVAIGMILILITLVGLFSWWRESLFDKKWFLRILVLSVLGPQIANQLGWFSAEVGRQPYVVYNHLLTAEGLSKTVSMSEVVISLILFGIIYLFLFALFIYMLNEKISHGPSSEDLIIEGHRV